MHRVESPLGAKRRPRCREKKLLASSDDYGRDLTGVQNLKKKLKRLENELGQHEPNMAQVVEKGRRLLESHQLPGAPEVQERLAQLEASWHELRRLALGRARKLAESDDFQQFLAKVDEEEAWITEKQQVLSVDDYGDSIAAVQVGLALRRLQPSRAVLAPQGLKKKHDAFEVDLAVHNARCREIDAFGEQLIAADNHHAPLIRSRLNQLRQRLEALTELARRRLQRLLDNSAYLQFIWKCDVVESWMGEKEAHVRSDDFGRDLSSVQILLTKQEAFDAGLNAFEHEGIQRITELQDQLAASRHHLTPQIHERHANVMARWQRLLANSAERRQKLLRMLDQYKKIEELYLTFAKKASAFNSWFENAEEDLTDPVRCNSLEEIRALREAHAQFQASLSTAEKDFRCPPRSTRPPRHSWRRPFQAAAGAGPPDQVVQRRPQPVHLVHHGRAGGDVEEPAEDHQGAWLARAR